jgi:hypothetical protein
MKPVLKFSRKLMTSVGPLVALTAAGDAPWSAVKPELDRVVSDFVEISLSTKTLYSKSGPVQSALLYLDIAKQALTDRFQAVAEPGTSTAQNAALAHYGNAVQAAAVAVETAAEAHVYGGAWLRFGAWRSMRAALNMLRRQGSV